MAYTPNHNDAGVLIALLIGLIMYICSVAYILITRIF